MVKTKKWIKRIVIGLLSLFVLLVVGLFIYSQFSYDSLEAMDDQIALIDDSNIEREENFWSIQYKVDNPIKNIIFVPGGLVEPDAYSYIALSLAVEGYKVSIIKPLFNLAILTPNHGGRYIDESLDNVIIGHSLGGIVSSMIASKNESISQVVLMGAYAIKDISDKDVMLISAEFDLGMDQETFEENLKYVNDDYTSHYIVGGNHAQFGWYGKQRGDGDALISTLVQQDLVIDYILDFIDE